MVRGIKRIKRTLDGLEKPVSLERGNKTDEEYLQAALAMKAQAEKALELIHQAKKELK